MYHNHNHFEHHIYFHSHDTSYKRWQKTLSSTPQQINRSNLHNVFTAQMSFEWLLALQVLIRRRNPNWTFFTISRWQGFQFEMQTNCSSAVMRWARGDGDFLARANSWNCSSGIPNLRRSCGRVLRASSGLTSNGPTYLNHFPITFTYFNFCCRDGCKRMADIWNDLWSKMNTELKSVRTRCACFAAWTFGLTLPWEIVGWNGPGLRLNG